MQKHVDFFDTNQDGKITPSVETRARAWATLSGAVGSALREIY